MQCLLLGSARRLGVAMGGVNAGDGVSSSAGDMPVATVWRWRFSAPLCTLYWFCKFQYIVKYLQLFDGILRAVL